MFLLENIDFKSALHFSEFPPVSTAEWEALIEKDLKGKDYKQVLQWNSGEGVQPLPFYRTEQLKKLNHVPAPLSSSTGWAIMQSVEVSNISEANKLALKALNEGASGLKFTAHAAVIQSKSDLEKLLNDIQFEYITLLFGHSLSTPKIARWLQEICEQRKIDVDKLNVYFTFCPFSRAVQTGMLREKDSLSNLITESDFPFHFFGVEGSPYANAGATIVQQLAFMLAAGNEFLGMKAELAGRLSFNFSSGPYYFLEIAKLRAFKLLWEQVTKEYGTAVKNPFISAETAGWNKAKTDAHNNLLRTTTEAISAILGGCNALTVHRFDRHFADYSNFASRIARNIQLILQEESYLGNVADPGAGSYYIEALTDSIAQNSWKQFQKIEEKGGLFECLKSGFIQQLIAEARQDKVEAYRKKEKLLVGVNKYQPEEQEAVSLENQENTKDSPGHDSFIEIEKIRPLNLEAELQKGAAS